MNFSTLFKGFSKLDSEERYERLLEMGILSYKDIKYLKSGSIKDITLGEKFIENVIGYMQVPLGVATNFCIDGKEFVIPMAVEETSIIAAVSKSARWINECGFIQTRIDGDEIIGQIQISHVKNYEKLKSTILKKQRDWLSLVNREVAETMVKRGGGVKRFDVRKIDRPGGGEMAVIHVYADTCDAMGANIINQICEFLKGPIEYASGEKVTMCILSNLADTKRTFAKVVINDVEPHLGRAIAEASLFAQLDPYRAATNNKGVLNGIDPILVATGNDWRAVEAGIHAFAARDGQYRSITKWGYKGGVLTGEFEAPIIVGTVGGVTNLHPTAQMCLRMMNVQNANELSRICAAVGLVQNLGALRALTTVGIIEGHMKLHIKNLSMGAGANEDEIPILQKKLEEILAARKRITLTNAIELLREIRIRKPEEAPSEV